MPYPLVDDALAGEVLDRLGLAADADVEDVVAAFRAWLPSGSTAKWAAVDRGERPPGDDPAHALEARLAGSWESWSCWPVCTGLGGVLAAVGHDVRMVAEHRRGGGQVPPVDYHSVLVVDGCLVDPYLGPTALVPPGHDVVAADGWASWVPGQAPDHRFDHLGATGGGRPFRYRQLADHLDRRDVVAFCDVSTTHTGVGRRRTAHWVVGGIVWHLREADDGRAELRRTIGTGPFETSRRLEATGDYDDLLRQHLPR